MATYEIPSDPNVPKYPLTELIQMCDFWALRFGPEYVFIYFCTRCEHCDEAIMVAEPFTSYEALECPVCAEVTEFAEGWLRVMLNPNGEKLVEGEEGIRRVQQAMEEWGEAFGGKAAARFNSTGRPMGEA